MSKPKILIFGAGGHARVIIDIVEKQGTYTIAGLIDDTPSKRGTRLENYEILGATADIPQLQANLGLEGIIIALGDNCIRSRVTDKVKSLCSTLVYVIAIHP